MPVTPININMRCIGNNPAPTFQHPITIYRDSDFFEYGFHPENPELPFIRIAYSWQDYK